MENIVICNSISLHRTQIYWTFEHSDYFYGFTNDTSMEIQASLEATIGLLKLVSICMHGLRDFVEYDRWGWMHCLRYQNTDSIAYEVKYTLEFHVSEW